MSSFLNVKIIGQRRKARDAGPELVWFLQNYLRAIVVFFYFATDLHHLAGKLPHIANLFQIIREHDNRERTKPVIFAKIQKSHSPLALFYPNHFSGHALGFAQMIPRLIKRDAGSKRKARQKKRG